MSDWNRQVIEQFRATGGKMGGDWAGQPLLLLHHRGRRSGAEHVAPVMYLADEQDPGTVYVFASKAGAPSDPEWYRNLMAAGEGRVERGEEAYDVAASELEGEARDRIFTEQVRRYPQFGEYAEKAEGVRTIPVVALRRR
jgi:deazaflavin-dependent oxidoreductase (nitroreductase family)